MATLSVSMTRLRRPSLVEFRTFVERRVPVVIEGAMDGWGARSWTLERLGTALGKSKVQVQVRYGHGCDEFEYRDVPFDRFAESMRGDSANAYLAAAPLLDLAPELWSDLRVPEYAGRLTVSPRVYVGPRGAVTPLHADRAHGLGAQLLGRKKIVVVAFRRRDILRHAELRLGSRFIEPIDVESRDDVSPLGLVPETRWEAVVEPGDIVYFPWRRHHLVRALEESISVNFFWQGLSVRIAERAWSVISSMPKSLRV